MQATNKIQLNSYSDLMKASVFVTDHTGQKCNTSNRALSLLQRKAQPVERGAVPRILLSEQLQKERGLLGQVPSKSTMDVLGTLIGPSQIRY